MIAKVSVPHVHEFGQVLDVVDSGVTVQDAELLYYLGMAQYHLKEKTQRELLPLRREGNLDYSVIEEGGRRVRNRLQEDGYFFAEITPVCTVTPPGPNTVDNGSNETCRNLVPEGLTGHTVTVTYDVTLNPRLKLADIRITGTDNVSPADIADYLKSREASGPLQPIETWRNRASAATVTVSAPASPFTVSRPALPLTVTLSG